MQIKPYHLARVLVLFVCLFIRISPFLQHECQHHHSKTKKHSKKSKKHHRKRSRSRSVSTPHPRLSEADSRNIHSAPTDPSCLLLQGSESEEDEYHSKKKKRSTSKSPSEHSSSGESG